MPTPKIAIALDNYASKDAPQVLFVPSEYDPQGRMNIVIGNQIVASVLYREVVGALVEFKMNIHPHGLILPPKGHKQELKVKD